MKGPNKLHLIINLFVIGILFSAPAMAYNVVVGDHGGAGTSTNGSFVNQVWTPIGDSNLDFADLLAEISGNDVEIITNGSGNITVNTVFYYTLAVNRKLAVSASGNVILSGIYANSTGSISVEASASGTVTVDQAGMNLNGGFFTSSGTDHLGQGGVITGGGNVELNHSGSVTITGAGVYTDSGSFASSGTGFSISSGGLHTGGGNVELNHTGSVMMANGGITTDGGSFTSSGTDFYGYHTGVQTNSGNVLLNHTGSVFITNNGIGTGGGSFRSSGTDFTCGGDCLRTNTGDVTVNHSGIVEISEGGVSTGGGNIFVQSNGLIDIMTGTNLNTGDPNNGGDITLRSATGITIDTAMVTQPGVGGKLTLEGETGAIALNQAPQLGQGDITLYVGVVGGLLNSIPTLSEWAMVILSLVLLLAAYSAMRRRSLELPKYRTP